MSRIGIKPIAVPEDLKAEIAKTKITLYSAQRELSVAIPPRIKIELEDKKIKVLALGGSKKVKALHGLTRSLIANVVSGLKKPFQKTLEVKGVGYRVKIEGEKLVLTVGFTHQVEFPKPNGIDFEVKGTKITVSGADKQLVGETAAKIRRIKIPDAYKGKGIRYEGEIIKLKPGKAVKGAAAGGK